MRGWMNMEEKKKDERLEENEEALTDESLDAVDGGVFPPSPFPPSPEITRIHVVKPDP